MKHVIASCVLLAACSGVEPNESVSIAEVRGADVTRIRVNGESAYTNLFDPNTGTQGFAWPTRDNVANTTSLDFSYATPTSDPDIVSLVQGAGEIPNSAFTTTNNTAHLVVTTPFPVIHCDVNLITGDFTCAEGDPIPFDLVWEQNGFSEVEERVQRREKIGPLTIRYHGTFHQRSALVNGFWNGNTAVDMSGDLFDTQNTTVIREITMAR